MRKYIDEIENLIELQLKKIKGIAFIKLEGFESPYIYKEVCKYFKNSPKVKLEAKMSKEKYEEFENEAKKDWETSISFLKENGYVNFDSTMTDTRNSIVNIEETNKNYNLILLMGTEVVEDKGGLADFYTINPQSIINKLQKNYSLWLKDDYEEIFRNKDNERAFNTLFKVIFKNASIDLIKFSNLMEEIISLDLSTINEIIEEVCFNLSEYYCIPSIRNKKSIPKVSSLKNGKISAASIIEKSAQFIERTKFRNGLKSKEIKKYEEKLNEYADKYQIVVEDAFPSEDAIFSSYNEFKNEILNFIRGKKNAELKKTFLKIDYAIIDEIFKFKLSSPEKIDDPKEKEINITGEPLEVYGKAIIKSIIRHKAKSGVIPEKVIFQLNEMKLVNDDEQDYDGKNCRLYYSLCSRLGGIINFFNDDENEFKVEYFDGKDPFDTNEERPKIKLIKSLTELCKIKFEIISISEETEDKFILNYCFNPMDSWLNDYMLLNKDNIIGDENEEFKLPLYIECDNIQDYMSCEVEEEFFIKLQKIKMRVLNFKDLAINNNHSDLENRISNTFGKLKESCKEFIMIVKNKGIYSTFVEKNVCSKLFKRYVELLNIIKENYDNFTSQEKENIYLFLNLFLIGDSTLEGSKSGKLKNVIMPPYHPIMLEKILCRCNYIKSSFYEILDFISINTNIKEKNAMDKFDTDLKMCSINSGMDIYSFSSLQKDDVDVGKLLGKYALYSSNKYSFEIISNSRIRNDIIEYEDINLKDMTKKSYKSDIITNNIVEYIKTFPARADGINLLFVNPDDMQHIVSGIHSAIDEIKKFVVDISIQVRILIPFSRIGGKEYLRYWLDNCFIDDDDVDIKTYLNYIDLGSDKLKKYIENEDITYVYKILDYKFIDFIKSNNIQAKSDSKYPATYVPMPVSISQNNRKIDISQRQFEASNSYLQLLHKVLRPNEEEAEYTVIKTMEINEKNIDLIGYIHEKSRWVVCLDESIDKSIINKKNSKVIAFSTGKGDFGELNTTLSAREDILKDLQLRLKERLLYTFGKWNDDIADKAAQNCINISKDLDGARLMIALSPQNTQLHNYLAYVLTMQVININSKNNLVIRNLINLDNYSHWFKDDLQNYAQKSSLRPDFMVLEIENYDGLLFDKNPIKIKITVIECKMAKENEEHVKKAKRQMLEGLKKLSDKFSPHNNSVNKRYWFNQLYRALIFSKINLNDNTVGYDVLINKISDIYNGNYEIEWNGSIYTYWINIDSDKMITEDIDIPEDFDVNVNSIQYNSAGQLYIQKLLLPKEIEDNFKIEFNEEEEKKEELVFEKLGDDENELANKKETIISSEDKIDSKEKEEFNYEKDEEDIKNAAEENKDNNITSSETIHDSEDKNIKIDKNEYVRFLLGEDIRTKEKIYWEYKHKDLNNRHLLINGNSGSGKTYCIQALILEAVKNNISVIVFDYTDGFTESKLSPILLKNLGDKFESRLVKYEKFPINPFKKGTILIGNKEVQELDQDIANRIADSFAKVYNFGEQQRSAIYSAVKEGLKKYGDSMTLAVLRDMLVNEDNKSAKTVLSKVEALVDYEPFLSNTDFTWKNIIDEKGKMYVIQLSGYSREIQVILTELILWDIWNYAVKYGNEETPIPIILDEAQNLSHDENSPSGKILAEGRKFGISGWYATQFMAGRLSPGEIGNLQQAAQKLYFSPPEQSTLEVGKYIDISSEESKVWAEKLRKLVKGQCVTVGYKAKEKNFGKYEPRIIKITSLEERI